MATLSTFWSDVRSLLRDKKATSKYADELITGVLDRWINAYWPKIVDRVPHYYFKESATITGITDAVASTDDEQYTLPTDFRSALVLRRTDLTDKPSLRYSGPVEQNQFRFTGAPFREPEADEPTYTQETWAFYGATKFRILPAPTATTYTYKFEYLRKHTAAASGGDTVDIPDEVYSLAVSAVAARCVAMQEPGNAELIAGITSLAKMESEMFQEVDRKAHRTSIPEMVRFW